MAGDGGAPRNAPAAAGETVDLESVTFGYRDDSVVRDVTFAAPAGGFVGIIGPNGSGKSTLLKLIGGVVVPWRGRVRVGGDDVRRLSRVELGCRVAVVPQETDMPFPYSVLEMVLLGRTPHRRGFVFDQATDLRIALAALERTGTGYLVDRPVTELSGGERQRVVLARALAQEPRVLLLDEPSAFLDIRHEVEMYDLLRTLQRDGLTVISVLHDLNLAALYCEHIILLADGAVHCQGEPSEVMTYSNLSEVYETEVYVAMNDITNTLNILPLDARNRHRLSKDARKPESGNET